MRGDGDNTGLSPTSWNLGAVEVLRAPSLPAALRPTAAPWAVRPALWAVLGAGVVASAGVVRGDLVTTGLAYFGVACAAVLVTSGVYRARVISLACQAGGATVGIVLGVAVADSVPAKVAVAAAVAMLSGMIGAVGRLATAGALMAVIGLSFGEFARVQLPGWEQGTWYLVGTFVLAVFALAGWPVYRDRAAWAAVAAVFDGAASLVAHIGRDGSSTSRLELAAASAASRTEVFDHRLNSRFGTRGSGRRLRQAADVADQAALAAAALLASELADAGVADGLRGVVDGLRRAATDSRSRKIPTLPTSLAGAEPIVRQVRPLMVRARVAVQVATDRSALLAGLRLAVCMTAASAITCALHTESHSFWLPLTVAVAVRPEYASVFVRIVNRVAGTAAGALLAAGAIAVLGSGWPVAVAAAVSLGFAVLAVPKLYGLSVVGVTCSALLSSCIGAADPISPPTRLLDTLIGCAIAIVLGYLIWPDRHTAPVVLTKTAIALTAYLEQAVRPPHQRRDWTAVRDRAYRLAHQSRQAAQAALLDPQPIHEYAVEVLPRALNLENLVDEVTMIANLIDSGAPPPPDQEAIELNKRIWATTQAAPAFRRR